MDAGKEKILKRCKKCGDEKSIDSFVTKKYRKVKDDAVYICITRICKKCAQKIHKEYYAKNPDSHKRSVNKWKEKNRQKIKEIYLKWYLNNIEKKKKYDSCYRKNNIEKMKKYYSCYRKNNREKINYKSTKYKRLGIENLSPFYVNAILNKKGFRYSEISKYPELIETQRLIIQTKRLCRTLQNSEKV